MVSFTDAVQIGNVYMEQGDLEAALSTYMEALENSPDNPDILTTLGITFLRCACSRSIRWQQHWADGLWVPCGHISCFEMHIAPTKALAQGKGLAKDLLYQHMNFSWQLLQLGDRVPAVPMPLESRHLYALCTHVCHRP